ncbi:MAG TPA: cupin domain-containing protein [Dissulfurispiraceae bacterium]|nr:cupin domain-containing protein [Dissulfurispiraceae bacterium]
MKKISGAACIKNADSCDWHSPEQCKKKDNRNRIYRFDKYTWQGVNPESYKPEPGDWAAIERQVIIGSKGETPLFHLRYFEIAPGGYSSHEQHAHEHVIVCIRGRGMVRIGRKKHSLRHLDTVYIAPGSVHQFNNPNDEPFGFLCIVNAERDRPVLIELKKMGRKHSSFCPP